MSEASHVPRGRSSPLPALLAVVLLCRYEQPHTVDAAGQTGMAMKQTHATLLRGSTHLIGGGQ